MVTNIKLLTIADFRAYTLKAENADKRFELINGEIVDVSPSRTRNSQLHHLLAYFVLTFCKLNQTPCYTSGGDGAYEVQGHVVAPDFAYKTTPMSDEYPDPVPPLWVVEIISPTDKILDIRAKRQIYLRAGILYWEMYPESRSIDIYPPGEATYTVEPDGELTGGKVLPGFKLAMKDLFAE